ncbi:phage protein [Tetrasphaera phage TJE1]|uniref:Phage protein n=1 Tax=Tetrasphaera phage TJE1 TaxID=981335 RepID=G4W957_9CAUD|nr:head maturation protease [Tetrasphaera phage TJE1]ADX42545.1 phage protein [Tetrasphaera phage TJE1]
MGELVQKNVAIARSGVQRYLRRELPALKVGPVPDQHKDKKEFHVYRSAPLIADSKDLFTRKPFIYTHKAYINPSNFTENVQGWTGDEATVELNEAKTEAIIRTGLTIGGEEAMDAFQNRGEREVSPLYFGKFEWKDGVSPDGTPYEIEMVELTGVNHVALVPAGRGGPDAAILDHLEQEPGMLTGIWRFIKRLLGGVGDELPNTFRTRLEEISKARATYTEESICDAAKILWDCITDIPFTDDLGLLQRYLSDIKGLARGNDKGVNAVTDEEAATYVKLVSDLYEKLDQQSLEEVTKQGEESMAKSADEMAKEEEDKKKAASADADKEWADLASKMEEHRKAGGKASDWKMGASKDEDETEAEAKREEEERKKKEAAAKDAEAEETKKKEEEEAKKKADEEKAKAADAAAVADAATYGAPWAMRIGPTQSAPASDPGLKVLGNMGYGPGKEKK